jgi:hypothetical protein
MNEKIDRILVSLFFCRRSFHYELLGGADDSCLLAKGVKT